MNDAVSLHIPFEALADFCRRYQVRELALFGSMLRQDHRPDSDVELLVSFAPSVTLLSMHTLRCIGNTLKTGKVSHVRWSGRNLFTTVHLFPSKW
jgi:predicted nucleotidyltransferase